MNKRKATAGAVLIIAVTLVAFLWPEPKARLRTPPGEYVGRLPPHIKESSGLVASRKSSGVLWTHGDSGTRPTLFAVTREGKQLGAFQVNVENRDWESIATDDDGFLYIADTGNNSGKRGEVHILQVAEPDMPKDARGSSSSALDAARKWRLTYPNESFDSEGLLIHGGHGYLISKVERGEKAALYSFPLNGPDELVQLQKVCALPITSPVSGADMSPDGGRVAVLAQNGLHIFEITGDLASLGTSRRTRVVFERPHAAEGCSFFPGGILITTETGEIYFFADAPMVGDEQP